MLSLVLFTHTEAEFLKKSSTQKMYAALSCYFAHQLTQSTYVNGCNSSALIPLHGPYNISTVV